MADEPLYPNLRRLPDALVQLAEPVHQMLRGDTFGRLAAATPACALADAVRQLTEALRGAVLRGSITAVVDGRKVRPTPTAKQGPGC